MMGQSVGLWYWQNESGNSAGGGVGCYVMGQSVGLWYWQNESGNSAGGGVGC